jgi:hypothetical protein
LEGGSLKSVYVTGMTWWTTDQDVRQMVMEVVGVGPPFNVVFDENKVNGKSMGSVLIDIQTDQAANLVIQGLHGKRVNNKELKAELFGQSSDGTGDMQPAQPASGDARHMAQPGLNVNANATPLGEKRKPLEEAEGESSAKRMKTEPGLERKAPTEGKEKSASTKERSEKKSRDEEKDKDRHRTTRSSKHSRGEKEDRKERSSRKEEERKERHSKHEKTSSSTRHRHRHHEDSEDESEGEPNAADAKAKRRAR